MKQNSRRWFWLVPVGINPCIQENTAKGDSSWGLVWPGSRGGRSSAPQMRCVLRGRMPGYSLPAAPQHPWALPGPENCNGHFSQNPGSLLYLARICSLSIKPLSSPLWSDLSCECSGHLWVKGWRHTRGVFSLPLRWLFWKHWIFSIYTQLLVCAMKN